MFHFSLVKGFSITRLTKNWRYLRSSRRLPCMHNVFTAYAACRGRPGFDCFGRSPLYWRPTWHSRLAGKLSHRHHTNPDDLIYISENTNTNTNTSPSDAIYPGEPLSSSINQEDHQGTPRLTIVHNFLSARPLNMVLYKD